MLRRGGTIDLPTEPAHASGGLTPLLLALDCWYLKEMAMRDPMSVPPDFRPVATMVCFPCAHPALFKYLNNSDTRFEVWRCAL